MVHPLTEILYTAALALDHVGSILTVYMYVYNIHNIYIYLLNLIPTFFWGEK